MALTNNEIATHVETLAASILADKVVEAKYQPVIDAAKALVTTFLQNLNSERRSYDTAILMLEKRMKAIDGKGAEAYA